MSRQDLKRPERCEGKHNFESMALAQKTAKRSRRKDAGRGLHAYRCPSCHGVHIGALMVARRPRRRPAEEDGGFI